MARQPSRPGRGPKRRSETLLCVAVPLKVLRVDGAWAYLEAGSGEIKARTDLVGVAPGDYALLHAGFIIEKLDPKDAEETLRLFKEVSEP